MWSWLRNITLEKKNKHPGKKPIPERIKPREKTINTLVKNKRRPRGRPPILNKLPKSRLALDIETKTLNKFREYCDRHDTSITHALTLYMQRAITEEEAHNYHNLVALRLKPKKKAVPERP